MRFKVDTSVPKEGNRRAVTKFAWLPTRVKLDGLRNADGSMKQYDVWLENYIQIQKYSELYGWMNKEKLIYGNSY